MTPERAEARLLDDAGAAAQQSDFFRSREFFDAEKVSHTLLITSAECEVALPVLARATPDGAHLDAISPYGYPGAALRSPGAAAPIDPTAVDWSATGLVSVFARDALGVTPLLAGATDRSAVQISDPELPRKSRMSDRQQVRRNERDGYSIEMVAGPDADDAAVGSLAAVYDQTMAHTEAADRYLFDSQWFATVLRSACSWLFLMRARDGGLAAAALAVESDAIIHYYLSGTADEHRRASPSKNLIAAVIDFAESRGMPMNLGGGLRAGDSLEAFKKGFANRELRFRTHELICDPARYASLSGGRDDRGFFPAYRSSER